jgi:1,2-diacylglycerol 3-beta-galactosyltransferase
MLGMPIHPKFSQSVESKEVLRQKFGLRPDVPVVLLVGGGDGAGGLYSAVRAISQAHLPVQLLVVTGRNKHLYARLQRTRSSLHVPATIFGFVQNMPELMHAADLIVTKAGPGTICEALACHLPIVLSGYVPGQEEGNIEYVVNNHVGTLALEPRVLVEAIKKLITSDAQELREQQEQAKRISRPRASFDIGICILSFLPERAQPSIWQSSDWRQRQARITSRLRHARRLRHRRLARARQL